MENERYNEPCSINMKYTTYKQLAHWPQSSFLRQFGHSIQRPRRLHNFPPLPLEDGVLLIITISSSCSSQLGDIGREPLDS